MADLNDKLTGDTPSQKLLLQKGLHTPIKGGNDADGDDASGGGGDAAGAGGRGGNQQGGQSTRQPSKSHEVEASFQQRYRYFSSVDKVS